MAVTVSSLIFGDSNWGEDPWYQWDATEVKEASNDALSFLQQTIGLHGTYHDGHGWMVDMDSWVALREYVQIGIDNGEDFLLHVDKVTEDDPAFCQMANNRMEALCSKVSQVK